MGSLMEYRRRILLNTPHIESVSGSVAHFSTDMAAKLKECKISFLPQQAGSGDPSPSNVRAISGWTGCDVVRSGKNVGHVVGYSAVGTLSPTAVRRTSNNYGTTISTLDFSAPDGAVVVTQSTQSLQGNTISDYRNGSLIVVFDNLKFYDLYRISFKISNITSNPLNASLNNIRVYAPNGSGTLVTVDGNVAYCDIWYRPATNTPLKSELDIRICGMSFTLSEFMVTPVEDEDYTYAPYDPDKITVSWNNLGTIYGGFIDVLRGELVQEWEIASARWGDIRNDSPHETTGLYEGFVNFSNRIIVSHSASDDGVNIICNATSNCLWNGPERGGNHYFSGNITTSKLGRVYAYFDSTLDDNVILQFCSRLETPITYPLTPETIKAIKGVNNVWSDAGDVSVKFWTH